MIHTIHDLNSTLGALRQRPVKMDALEKRMVTFLLHIRLAPALIILFSDDPPFVKTEAAQQGATEAMVQLQEVIGRCACLAKNEASSSELCFSRELSN